MAEKIERVRFLVPGTPASLEAWKVGSLDPSIEVEWVENDGTFGQAFSFGTVAPDIVETIDAVPGALVLYSSVGLREGRRQIVTAVAGSMTEHALESINVNATADRLSGRRMGCQMFLRLDGASIVVDSYNYHLDGNIGRRTP